MKLFETVSLLSIHFKKAHPKGMSFFGGAKAQLSGLLNQGVFQRSVGCYTYIDVL